ncbi:hypothetical protein FQN54_001297 [Arachnomyces sp. PD_36]|nr:hypothetical protein FQN54_001297 [Arachnomyces sp. PD_36]
MTSSFSPLDSPTRTPSDVRRPTRDPRSLPEAALFSEYPFEMGVTSAPARNGFSRTADVGFSDACSAPYSAVEGHDREALFEFVPGYEDNIESFWIPSESQKGHGEEGSFRLPQTTLEYPPMTQSFGPSYLKGATSNPCLSRSAYRDDECMLRSSSSPENLTPWVLSESLPAQTITPSQAFHEAPTTPQPSYMGYPPPDSPAHTHTPNTQLSMSPLETPSPIDSCMRSFATGEHEFDEEETSAISSALQARFRQRRGKRRPSKKDIANCQISKQSLKLENLPSIIRQVQFRCKIPDCKGKFKRQEHLKRHMKSHSQEKPHVCWVPGCNRGFSRSDNLNAHYAKTHSKRGGRNRYVATLDESSPDYDPDFRGPLTAEGRPIRDSTGRHASRSKDNIGRETWAE